MKITQKQILFGGVALLIIVLIISSSRGLDSLGRGGPKREERIISGQEKINAFKSNFDGQDIKRFTRKLNKMVRDFELNNDVHVIRSSVFSDGPIVVK